MFINSNLTFYVLYYNINVLYNFLWIITNTQFDSKMLKSSTQYITYIIDDYSYKKKPLFLVKNMLIKPLMKTFL